MLSLERDLRGRFSTCVHVPGEVRTHTCDCCIDFRRAGFLFVDCQRPILSRNGTRDGGRGCGSRDGGRRRGSGGKVITSLLAFAASSSIDRIMKTKQKNPKMAKSETIGSLFLRSLILAAVPGTTG